MSPTPEVSIALRSVAFTALVMSAACGRPSEGTSGEAQETDGGTQDAGENGLSGLTVTLTPAGGGTPVSVTTNATGDYSATIPAGDVDTDVTDPASSVLTTANDPQTVAVPVGGSASATDVGFQGQGTISGRVFDDVNGNGTQDGGENGLAHRGFRSG